MKASLEWLNSHLDLPAPLTADRAAELLRDLGLGVESLTPSPAGDGDVVLDVEVTSNRNDCNAHYGLARELAAVLGCGLGELDLGRPESIERDPPAGVAVDVQAVDLCPMYTARVLRDVRVGPSPDWLVRRLAVLGQRSVNNVVDITNYVLLELSQPLHAFDLDRLQGGAVQIRRAVQGERMLAIDGRSYALAESDCVIADGGGPVAIAGVMGGQPTEVGSGTTSVLLESAMFSPVAVRSTSRRLGLRSESSYRFERGVNAVGVIEASRLATRLMRELCGARPDGGLLCAGLMPVDEEPEPVLLRWARMRRVLGYSISPTVAEQILVRLGFAVEAGSEDVEGGGVVVRVPAWRKDCRLEVDLIEEVARVHGYGHIPQVDRVSVTVQPVGARQKVVRRTQDVLVGAGMREALCPAMLPDGFTGLFGSARAGSAGALRASERHRKTDGTLRSHVCASLLAAARHNEHAGNAGCRLFEISCTFQPTAGGSGGGLPDQPIRLGLLWEGQVRDLRGVVELLLSQLRVEPGATSIEPGDLADLSPGVGGWVVVEGHRLGWMGRLDRQVAARLDLRGVYCVAELDLDGLFSRGVPVARLRELPRFPAVERDLSILVGEAVRWMEVESAVREAGPPQLERVDFVEVFRGRGIEPGRKSILLRLTFREATTSLTHAVVDAWQARIVERLAGRLGAVLRTVGA